MTKTKEQIIGEIESLLEEIRDYSGSIEVCVINIEDLLKELEK